MANRIDELFRSWGVEHFGEEAMNKIPTSTIEELRIQVMNYASYLVSVTGEELPKDFIKETFFDNLQYYIENYDRFTSLINR